ncbi:MAG: hypothetical protein BZ136_08865, partial [Methanosphaera sp. rholeuAM74]
CLCNFELVGEGLYSVEQQSGVDVSIDSVVLKKDVNIHIESDKKYGVVKSPGFMNKDRSIREFMEYYYESNANAITVDKCDYYMIGEDNVTLY